MNGFTISGLNGAPPETEGNSIERSLEAIRTHLGMAVAYVSEFVGDCAVFRAVDAPGLEDAIKVGDSYRLDDVFCRHILEGRLPELMPDVTAIPFALTIPIMATLPIGAHMSVPIRLDDGETYGMFCCLNFKKNLSLNKRDLNMMRVFAELTGHQITRDRKVQRAFDLKRSRIEAIIEQRLFTNVYQPICDLASGLPIGFETLCRFRSEPYRSPDKWFADAVEVDRGVELERAVMEQALEDARALPADVYLSINASPDLLLSGVLPTVIRAHPERHILVEVTEHAAIDDYGELKAAITDLRSAGAAIAVDDAGAGYSGLQHIIQIHPDVIKLDTTLVRDIDSDPARRALMSALIFFGRETGCVMIAEGVETDAELRVLRSLGVSKAQGYLLGRPMPIADACMRMTAPIQSVA